MRLMSAFLCCLFLAPTLSLAAEKDTALAANTRKKLLTKISVEFKEEKLKDCMEEISRQLDDAGAGKISCFYDAGVSMNQPVTYSAKNQTVVDILDAMLKKNALGYIVHSKERDAKDGFLRIKQGNERGFAAGDEAKIKPPAAVPDKPAPEPAATPDPDKDEKTAAAKLEFARSFLRDGKTDRAKQRFEEIIKHYPSTKAAAEAKKELAKLEK